MLNTRISSSGNLLALHKQAVSDYFWLLLLQVYHHIRNIHFLIDQPALAHPVDVFLPALFGLGQKRNLIALHERQKCLTGLLLHALGQREVFLILIIHQDCQAAIRIVLKVFKALLRCA